MGEASVIRRKLFMHPAHRTVGVSGDGIATGPYCRNERLLIDAPAVAPMRVVLAARKGDADARAACLAWAVEETLGPAFAGDPGPDLLVAPAYAPAWKSDLRAGDHFLGGGAASSAPSMAGWPVLCQPMGLVTGLPVGLVLIGRPHSEELLLAAGHAVEQALGLAGTLVPTWTPAVRG